MRFLFLRRFAVAGIGFFFLATGARAATLEIGPMAGWRFGGSFDDSANHSHTAEPSGSWGAVVDIYMAPGSALEVLFSRQESAVRAGNVTPAKFNFTLDHYQIGGLKEYGYDRFRPFLAGLLGWSHVDMENASADRFSVTMEGGAKYYLTPRLGLRGDIRCHILFGNNNAVAASSGPNGGSVSFAGDVFAQGEVAGGVFLAFGGPREFDSPSSRHNFPR